MPVSLTLCACFCVCKSVGSNRARACVCSKVVSRAWDSCAWSWKNCAHACEWWLCLWLSVCVCVFPTENAHSSKQVYLDSFFVLLVCVCVVCTRIWDGFCWCSRMHALPDFMLGCRIIVWAPVCVCVCFLDVVLNIASSPHRLERTVNHNGPKHSKIHIWSVWSVWIY